MTLLITVNSKPMCNDAFINFISKIIISKVFNKYYHSVLASVCPVSSFRPSLMFVGKKPASYGS